MPTYELIEAKTLTTTTASITFSSIPNTYTDLLLYISSRNSDIYNEVHFRFNGDTANDYSGRNLYGNGSSAISSNSSSISSLQNVTVQSVSGQTANTFGNIQLYIHNYLLGNYKSITADGVQENFGSSAQAMIGAGLYADTAAITSIQAFPSVGSFVANSNFYLYGIKNS